jgi:hypothetical protein
MAIIFVTVAVAACFMAVRTSIRLWASRLLIAFEAVVPATRRLWGTLAGGIAGRSQSIGAQFDAAWQMLAGLLFLLVLIGARRLLPEGLGRDMVPVPPRPSLIVAVRLLIGAAVALLAAGPLLLGVPELKLLTEFFCLLVLALMWNLLAGYADIVTVGQHAFVGVGAYAFYGFAALGGVDPYAAILLAGIVALLFALPAMAVVFRLRAAYLAVGTWVVAEVLMLIAGKLTDFGGGSGVSLPVSVVKTFGARATNATRPFTGWPSRWPLRPSGLSTCC